MRGCSLVRAVGSSQHEDRHDHPCAERGEHDAEGRADAPASAANERSDHQGHSCDDHQGRDVELVTPPRATSGRDAVGTPDFGLEGACCGSHAFQTRPPWITSSSRFRTVRSRKHHDRRKRTVSFPDPRASHVRRRFRASGTSARIDRSYRGDRRRLGVSRSSHACRPSYAKSPPRRRT